MNQQQDHDGVWRQSVPLPFFGGVFRQWFQCWECKVKFRSEQEYRDHYRSDHPETIS